ncbi:MAG: flagellar basal body-associated FliL family protein [Herminiimonas sp.]|nr:flagellar basal body-associated FliL family protein [Herminiimonas sp.]
MLKPKKERSIVVTASLVVAALVVAFAMTWIYLQYASKVRVDVAYAPFKPVVVRAQDYSIAASFVLQTSTADAAWVAKNQKQLEAVLQEALNEADANGIRAPNGLQALQVSLRNISNEALQTTKIQQVLLTDFIIQSN